MESPPQSYVASPAIWESRRVNCDTGECALNYEERGIISLVMRCGAVSLRRRRRDADIIVRRSSTADAGSAGVRRAESRRLARQPRVGGTTDHVRLRSPCAASRSLLRPRGASQQRRGSSSVAYRC